MSYLFQISHFIKHIFKSFHLHGIHSPFIFEFEKKCLRDTSMYEGYESLSRFRESLKSNDTVLSIKDYGAGSRVFKTNERKVRDILKYNSSSLKTAKLLYRVVKYFEVRNILELGTSLGIATYAMSLGNDECRVTSIEGSKEVANFARKKVADNLEKTSIVHGTFKDFFQGHLKVRPSGTYDLVYLDGHHNGKATLNYFEQVLPYTHNDTVIILDDIYWSKDMHQAWLQLTKHEQVTASINTFDLGFLFLRKEQRQQCFHIFL